MSSQSGDYPRAGIIRRLLAMVYDSLLLLGVAFAYGVLITIVRVNALGRDELDFVGLPLPLHILIWLSLWIILASYYVFCWTKRGQTLGMKTWRLRVETKDGNHLNARQAWQRCLLACLSALPAGLGYIWCWIGSSGDCWHDRWTHTQVVVLPKDKKANKKLTHPSQ